MKKFDIICSLGANCSAAHNLRYRNLRYYSLPFDWLYIDSVKPLEYLNEGFKDGFKNFCQKENLVKIEQNKEHMDCVSYYDTFTKYYFVNHFKHDIELSDEFDKVDATNKRRITRLLTTLSKAKKACFLLSPSFEVDFLPALKTLKRTLQDIYPSLDIEFIVVQFSCQKDETIIDDNITIKKFTRSLNSKDFHSTNEEWRFLDAIEVVKPWSIYRTLCKKYTFRLLINLIPISKHRKSMRRKYNV